MLPRYLLTGGYPQAALAATGQQAFLRLKEIKQYRRQGLGNLSFWRSPDGNEIDFIFEFAGEILPIEVKFQKAQQLKIQPGFQIFLKKMGLKHAVVISDQLLETRQADGYQIFIIPLALWGML